MEEVAAAVISLSNIKAPGCDGVVAEILKNWGATMIDCLHQFCQVTLLSHEVPLGWLHGIVVPIHKDGDPQLPHNYRPITLLSIVGKVYTTVLLNRLQTWSDKHKIIVDEQGGFRAHYGCPEQLFTLTELIKTRKNAKEENLLFIHRY